MTRTRKAETVAQRLVKEWCAQARALAMKPLSLAEELRHGTRLDNLAHDVFFASPDLSADPTSHVWGPIWLYQDGSYIVPCGSLFRPMRAKDGDSVCGGESGTRDHLVYWRSGVWMMERRIRCTMTLYLGNGRRILGCVSRSFDVEAHADGSVVFHPDDDVLTAVQSKRYKFTEKAVLRYAQMVDDDIRALQDSKEGRESILYRDVRIHSRTYIVDEGQRWWT